MITKDHIKEVAVEVLASKTPLIGSVLDADDKIKTKKEILDLSLQLNKSTIFYNTIKNIEEILITDGNKALKKKLDLGFFDYDDKNFINALNNKIENNSTSVYVKGPSVQETLMYILFILSSYGEKVKIIENIHAWNYYLTNRLLENCIVISTFYDDTISQEKGINCIPNNINIFIMDQAYLTSDTIELKNRLSELTCTKLKEYTHLEINEINHIISRTFNLFSYYKTYILSENFTLGIIQHFRNIKQSQVIPMLLFPMSIEKNLYEDYNVINELFGKGFINSYIDNNKFIMKSEILKKYYIPSRKEYIFESIRKDMDNFKDLNIEQVELFFEVAIKVLTSAPKWYNHDSEYLVRKISEGQMNYSQDFFSTIIDSIQLLKETQMFDEALDEFYNKIYSIELDDLDRDYFLENMGRLIYIYPRRCYELFNDASSNFKSYLEIIFTMESRKNIINIEYPFSKIEHYIEKIMYHPEMKDFFLDIVFFLQEDSRYRKDIFSSFMTHYFSGSWWNLPYGDECIIEFVNTIKNSQNHEKLLKEIFKVFLSSDRHVVFVIPLEDSLGYKKSNEYRYHTREIHNYFYDVVLKETMDFELIDYFFSGDAKCYYSLFDSIIYLLNNHRFDKFELGKLESHLVYFLHDKRKYKRNCEKKVLDNIEEMLKIIRNRNTYISLIRFIVDDCHRNIIENPPIYDRTTHNDNESYYCEEVREAVKNINWPMDLFDFIDELGFGNFKNYRLLTYSFVGQEIEEEKFIEELYSFKYRNDYLSMYYVVADYKALGFSISFKKMSDILDSTTLSNIEKGNILKTATIDTDFYSMVDFDKEVVEHTLINYYAKVEQLLELYDFAMRNNLKLAAISLAQKITFENKESVIPHLFDLLNNSIDILNNDELNLVSCIEEIYEYMINNNDYKSNIKEMMIVEYKYYNVLKKVSFIEKYATSDFTFLIDICKNLYRDDDGNMNKTDESSYFFIYDLIRQIDLKFETNVELIQWCKDTLQLSIEQNYKIMGMLILAAIMAKIHKNNDKLFYDSMIDAFFVELEDEFYSSLLTNVQNAQTSGVHSINQNNPAAFQIEAIIKFEKDLKKAEKTSNAKLIQLFEALITSNVNWKNREEARARTTLGF